jgi:hypothetical protein
MCNLDGTEIFHTSGVKISLTPLSLTIAYNDFTPLSLTIAYNDYTEYFLAELYCHIMASLSEVKLILLQMLISSYH